ncbi:putative transketolase, thiamine disphosphate-binding N subunit [Halobacteriovorax marinus SJ]|uniref:Transketolase, thiamine disphosphate-binding N subunit n=1 Tax=Halobacteriovorax marinus (strain ATCC BAA-682 / DSM 15412 / SJ) TaxID=862908 RepID=E1WZX2_HALMS|nr:transketolase [Halobacteriovorax marinus]CBW27908.1 putative transketolase, thiamine disphosphate-binding N subunit [Halobacteriovorax marinus SJ]
MIDLKAKSLEIRKSIIETFIHASRGHVPSAFSLVEILVTLYYQRFEIDSDSVGNLDRDRIILSKGHGCLALYSILADKGFFSKDELLKFCKIDGILGGHPSRLKVPGVDVSTGSLGHGLSVGIGMAHSLRLSQKERKVVVILGDGECNEGSIWEAALSASKHKLNNLIVLIDHNKYQSYGPNTEVCPLDPFSRKWESFGFETFEVDMINSPENLLPLLENTNRPRAIICHTIKGQGHKLMEGDLSWHHKNRLSPQEQELLREGLK